MKKPYMPTIIGSCGGDCFSRLIFPIYGSKVRFFEGNFFWVGQYDPPPPFQFQPSY